MVFICPGNLVDLLNWSIAERESHPWLRTHGSATVSSPHQIEYWKASRRWCTRHRWGEHPPQDYRRWRIIACPGCSACSSGAPPLACSCRTHKNGNHMDGNGSCWWAWSSWVAIVEQRQRWSHFCRAEPDRLEGRPPGDGARTTWIFRIPFFESSFPNPVFRIQFLSIPNPVFPNPIFRIPFSKSRFCRFRIPFSKSRFSESHFPNLIFRIPILPVH